MTIKHIAFLHGLALSAVMASACASKQTAPDVALGAGANDVPVRNSDPLTNIDDPKTSSGAKMPKSLQGVWHENSQHGRDQCERYRRLGPDKQPVDEASDPLVGALVINDRIVHAYSEYGEGDFFSIQNVQKLSPGQWRVRSRVYIDTMPSYDEHGTESVDLFLLRGGKLRWTKHGHGERVRTEGPHFFRCGAPQKGF